MRNSPLGRVFPDSTLRLGLIALVMILTCGCAAGPGRAVSAPDISQNPPMQAPSDTLTRAQDAAPSSPLAETSSSESAALAWLWKERTQTQAVHDFPIGPGDLLRIGVAGMPEFTGYEERVSPTGSLELPVIGTVQAAGLTQDGLRKKLTGQLGTYMRDPDVQVFVVEFASREVAVVGMVQKPGVYTLSDSSERLLDVLTQAGGLANTAASQVYFFPAKGQGQPLPAAYSVVASNSQSLTTLANRPDSIVIDLAAGQSNRFLELPARPGDVIIVPAAGQVMVQGWVHNPGSFPITPRMTVLGAVDAAGGATFSSGAYLLRETSAGTKSAQQLNLARIADGDEPDVPVESGDIVVVKRSAVGAIPYLLYTLITKFNTGAYAPL